MREAGGNSAATLLSLKLVFTFPRVRCLCMRTYGT